MEQLPHPITLPGLLRLPLAFVVALSCLFPARVEATTCAGATVLNPASLPINNQALICGATNDLNSTNVPGTLCGTGDPAGYKDGNEALYRLTPTTTGNYSINVTGQTWSSIQVWNGCPNAGGTCIFGDGNAANTTTIVVALTAGVQYYIWFDTWPTPNSPCPGTFSINPIVPPTNDNPCGATPLTVGTTCSYTTGNTALATATTGPPAPGCANYAGGDVWFSAVVPASGRLVIDTQTGGVTDGGMALYTTSPNTCSGTFTLVECDDDDSGNGLMPMIDRSGLTPGSTVWIRFWEYGNDSPGSFQICAYAPTPPANDEPCGATVLPVTGSCSPVGGTTLFAGGTVGPPAPTCANYAGGDVWYRFTVPANGQVIIETFAGTITDGGMAVYTAPSCTGTFTQISCDDDGGPGLMPYISLTGLAPGSTVWVRFWEYGNDNPGTFTICAHTPPPPPTGDCVYALNLFDSFGDGWGSSNVGVRINGGPWTYYTVGGSSNQVLIGLMIGDFIELTYDNSGPFQGENSFNLGLMGGGTYYNSGAAPPAGPAFGQLVDCVPPPAAPQDCVGGTTICNGQSFNNNSSNTGNVVDLNSANQGCLSTGERQGTWYYFSPSASGNIGFTIAPTGAIDYDFAVWGPMSTVTCPPNAPPLRCSYASEFSTFSQTGSYNTGLGNGASDVTETPGGNGWVSTLPVVAGQIYILFVDNFSSTGQAFNLSWQLSGGASLDCSVLPVSFLNVSAIQQHEAVDVAWTTQREEASDHFRVERSLDGRYFQPIGNLNAASVSTTAIDYHFIDRSPKNGPNHYRVVRVDEDGGTQVSNSVMVHFRAPGDRLVLVPNPAHDRIFLSLAPVDDAVNVHLFDATGRLLRTWVENVAAGPLTLPIGELESGAYTVLVGTASGEHLGHATFVKE